MSRLQELIQRLCPDGVEWVLLDNAIISLNTGLNPRQFFKLNTEDATNYYVTIRELHNNSIVFSDKTDRINDTALKLCNNRSNLEIGDVLFSGTGTIGETAIITAPPTNWNIKEGVYAIKPNATVIEPKFLMYLLKAKYIRKQFLSKAVGGTVKSVPMGELKKIRVPLPPLEVQQEIVRILDQFTQLTEELNERLEAERTARKQQYKYYLDQLLEFEDESIWVELGTVAKSVNTGLNPRRFFKLNTDDASNYYVTIRELQNNSVVFSEKTDRINDEALRLCNNRSNLEIGDILFSGTGTIGETAVVEKAPTNWNIKEGVYSIKPLPEKLNSRFLMYVLHTNKIKTEIFKKVAGGTVKSIPMGELRKLKIPVPPMSEQERLVNLIDRFDALCNDLTSGLPAEITARQKQYEYYRDKLLTFPERKEADA